MKSIISLIDANNFYVSCERVFNASLSKRPVIVLSNNDGCVISRSNEAKKIGITMGVPFFQIEDIISQHNVAVFSSNYALYGDMSRRVMLALSEFSPEVEIYSIDEAFMNLSGIRCESPTELGRKIQNTVYQWTGIPVSVGIAETKTLAKIANALAKRSEKAAGVLDLTDSPYLPHALAKTPVGEVWGIGRRYKKLLHDNGVRTALELKNLDDQWVRGHLTVVGLRLVHELRGIPCLALETQPPAKKTITVSRSFGQPVNSFSEIKEALNLYVRRAGERLRKHGLAAGVVTVFLHTNRFSKEPQHFGSTTTELAIPTDSTPELLYYALRGAEEAFQEGFQYKKAGVMLNELVPAGSPSRSFWNPDTRERVRELLHVVDKLNHKFGRDTVHFGKLATEGRWMTKAEKRSPRYTTRWEEVLVI
jgi:DNA polymerase V